MNELLMDLHSQDIRHHPDFIPIKSDGSMVKETVATLSKTVFGQERALTEIAQARIRAEAGFVNPGRPEFIGLFSGEPGTGKTETAVALAKLVSPEDWKNRLLVVDSATFSQDHDTKRITGAPNSYVGYGDPLLITPDFLAKRNVILVDELEKGSSAYLRLWLSVMDKGHLNVQMKGEDGKNGPVPLNFANTSLIFTTNVGSSEIRSGKKDAHGIGFHGSQEIVFDPAKTGLDALKTHFKFVPEFLNRIDAVVVFDTLTPPVFDRLVSKFLDEYNDNQIRGNNPVAVTSELRAWLIDKTDKHYGGRELKRTIDKQLIARAAEVKLSLPDGVGMIGDIDGDEITFWASRPLITAREKFLQDEETKKKIIPFPLPNPPVAPGDGTDGSGSGTAPNEPPTSPPSNTA